MAYMRPNSHNWAHLAGTSVAAHAGMRSAHGSGDLAARRRSGGATLAEGIGARAVTLVWHSVRDGWRADARERRD
jgi:hypothetical protein